MEKSTLPQMIELVCLFCRSRSTLSQASSLHFCRSISCIFFLSTCLRRSLLYFYNFNIVTPRNLFAFMWDDHKLTISLLSKSIHIYYILCGPRDKTLISYHHICGPCHLGMFQCIYIHSSSINPYIHTHTHTHISMCMINTEFKSHPDLLFRFRFWLQ